MRIVFMGTPEFSVPTLDLLLKAGQNVCAVVTAPDRPAGRGRQISMSPVKEFSLAHNIPVLQPEKLRDPEFLNALAAYKADLFIVVAFRMLPEIVWQMPPRGTINLHASLLPDYRGAAPINRVIMNGETRTGATTFFIEKEIDTGNTLLQYETEIPENWNAGDLHDHLKIKGAELVVQTVQALEKNQISGKPQDISLAQHTAPKIFREDTRIHFTSTAKDLHNLVRGLSPYPAAWCMAGDKVLKIYRTSLAENREENIQPGKVIQTQNRIWVSASDGWVEILDLQPEGRKRMETKAFLSGYSLPEILN